MIGEQKKKAAAATGLEPLATAGDDAPRRQTYVDPQYVPVCGECRYCLGKTTPGASNIFRQACIGGQEAKKAMQAANEKA